MSVKKGLSIVQTAAIQLGRGNNKLAFVALWIKMSDNYPLYNFSNQKCNLKIFNSNRMFCILEMERHNG